MNETKKVVPILPLKAMMSSSLGTIAAEYKPTTRVSGVYESESELENAFINILTKQGYELFEADKTHTLEENIRTQIERLNCYKFSDNDWNRFWIEHINNATKGVKEKSRMILCNTSIDFTDENGVLHNICLFDKKDPQRNFLQVMHQYTQKTSTRENRYDVTILVNGFPLVHSELKKRGESIREAFSQIKRYQRETFNSPETERLFQFVQIFVISNGTETKYYSNSTRRKVERENGETVMIADKSGSFEFTTYWADLQNNKILDLMDFARTFFNRHTLLNILARYCVLDSDDNLYVMRPYQIAGVEEVLKTIDMDIGLNRWSSPEAGGYIWHHMGTGKTLESFRLSTLITSTHEGKVVRAIHVVDTKDLDVQTVKDFERFGKGCVSHNRDTKLLKQQLENPEIKNIVTTIQKLYVFIKKYPHHPALKDCTIFTVDECQRSQYGKMHAKIAKAFKKHAMFGFTGTPIFAQNAVGPKIKGTEFGAPIAATTESLFGRCLHKYLAINALNDGVTLPYHVEYFNTMRATPDDTTHGAEVYGIDKQSALLNTTRIYNNVEKVFEIFPRLTKRSCSYRVKGAKVPVHGFSAMLATDNKEMAGRYYNAFKKHNELLPESERLKVAIIHTWEANQQESDDLENENSDESMNFVDARAHMDKYMRDYNCMFGTSFTTADFNGYRDDVIKRLRDRELDLLIVVDMFLTGCDVPTMNTLFLDKTLKFHTLFQAMARTNRILNSIKNCGNLVFFRDARKDVEDAVALFCDGSTGKSIVLRPFNDYFFGYNEPQLLPNKSEKVDENGNVVYEHIDGFVDIVNYLKDRFPLVPRFDAGIVSNEDKKEFVKSFGDLLRNINILSCFEEFDKKKGGYLSEIEYQDYKSIYHSFYGDLKKLPKEEKDKIKYEEIVFEVDLLKANDIDIDEIIKLIIVYRKKNTGDSEVIAKIMRVVDASYELRKKRDLILAFIKEYNGEKESSGDAKKQYDDLSKKEKTAEISSLIKEFGLNSDLTNKFFADAFTSGELNTYSGTFYGLFAVSLFSKGSAAREENIRKRITEIYEKYR